MAQQQLWSLKETQRKKIIEQSFQLSQHRHYRMPRISFNAQRQSVEDIPNVYNLYTQNSQGKQSNLLPLKRLIELKTRHNENKANVQGRASMNEEGLGQQCRRSRINRTLSKISSHTQVKSVGSRSWWCCMREDYIQLFETKQLAINDDSRYNELSTTKGRVITSERHKQA